jgi:hypothetical protein
MSLASYESTSIGVTLSLLIESVALRIASPSLSIL